MSQECRNPDNADGEWETVWADRDGLNHKVIRRRMKADTVGRMIDFVKGLENHPGARIKSHVRGRVSVVWFDCDPGCWHNLP